MTDFGSWIQENWYQLGTFFVQVGFLFLAFSFAGKLLRAFRASQEQLGALVKLSVAGNAPDRHVDSPLSNGSNVSPYWLPPSPAVSSPAIAASEHHSSGPGFFAWWKAPMGVTTGTSSFHRVLRWFQMPANS